jgi:hypothetical protein
MPRELPPRTPWRLPLRKPEPSCATTESSLDVRACLASTQRFWTHRKNRTMPKKRLAPGTPLIYRAYV